MGMDHLHGGEPGLCQRRAEHGEEFWGWKWDSETNVWHPTFEDAILSPPPPPTTTTNIFGR